MNEQKDPFFNVYNCSVEFVYAVHGEKLKEEIEAAFKRRSKFQMACDEIKRNVSKAVAQFESERYDRIEWLVQKGKESSKAGEGTEFDQEEALNGTEMKGARSPNQGLNRDDAKGKGKGKKGKGKGGYNDGYKGKKNGKGTTAAPSTHGRDGGWQLWAPRSGRLVPFGLGEAW